MPHTALYDPRPRSTPQPHGVAPDWALDREHAAIGHVEPVKCWACGREAFETMTSRHGVMAVCADHPAVRA